MKIKKSLLLLLLLFAILLIPSGYSQDFKNQKINQPGCGTPPMTEQQRKYTLNFVDKAAVKRKVGPTYIPIRIHRITRDDGTGGIAMGDVNEGVANLNNFYSEAGIEYYIASVNTIVSSTWYELDDSEESAMTDANSTYDAVNVYFAGVVSMSGSPFCGYARYPGDYQNSLNMVMANGCTLNGPNGTFVHEFGHFFNLAHTHNSTERGNTDNFAENVSRTGGNANCDTNGDMLCDTQADPNGSNDANCNFVNDGTSATDINGLTYTPDIDNIMSYYSDACGGIFTPEQYTRITNGLATRLTHTTYTLDAAPNGVVNASGLTATPNNSYGIDLNGIDLNWTDNATNEVGYLIERSSDAGTTWLSVVGGGVNQNITTFTDTTTSGNTSYRYRIKASNDSGNDYSNETSVTSRQLYCTPTHQSNSCDPNNNGVGVAIYNLELNGDGTGDIGNPNNGCNGPLSIFTSTHSANVTAGTTYNVIGDFFGEIGTYSQYFTIWMDVNQDGDFDDANEKIYQATTAQTSFTAPITIPASAINGSTTMRIRSGWSDGGQVTSPCDNWAFSEAEDYEFVVSGGTVPDTAPPVFENSTPNQSSVTQTSFTLGTDINEAGTIYYVVIADGESTPSSAEVKTGTGSGGAGQVSSGSAAVTAGAFSNNFSVTSLISETAYDVYVIAEDDNGTPNLQVSPVKIDVTTLPYPDPTITFSNINSTYGDANFNLAATSNSGGTISYSIEGANTTGTTLSGTNSETVTLGNVGSITVRATQAANGNFSSGTQDITLTIGAAALTVTANANQTKVYGETDPTLSYTIAGFQGTDTEANLDTPVSIARATGENVGNYTITPSAAADVNYSVSFVTAQFAICSKPVINAVSPTYGTSGDTVTISGTGFSDASLPTVTIGGVSMAVLNADETSIEVTLPADTCSGAIAVINSCGVTSNSISYEYAAPAINTVSPINGKSGDIVTINGTNFGGSSLPTVTIGGVSMAVNSATETSIEVILPADTCGGAIAVINSCSVISNSISYEYTPTTYTYNNGWSPSGDPTGIAMLCDNIIIAAGNVTIANNTNFNTLTVAPGASLTVAAGVTITSSASITLESIATNYSSLLLNGTIDGTVHYNRFVNSYTNDATNNDNDLVSAPLTGETFGSFAAANANLLASGSLRAFAPFDKDTGSYTNYDTAINSGSNIAAGTGYRVATNDGATVTFTGEVQTGNVTVNIVDAGPSYVAWNLIGNPYPSYVSASDFLNYEVATGVTNLSLLENASGIYGYDGDGTDGWDIITLANVGSRLLAPGQGFFVAADANDVAAHDLVFAPSMRRTGNSDDFISGRADNTLLFLKLKASTTDTSYKTAFYFNDNAGKALDAGYDAVIMGGSAPDFALYSHLVEENTGLPVALQALGTTDLSNITIPIGVNAKAGVPLTFGISASNLPAAVAVYLEDTLHNTTTLLTNSNYVVTPESNLEGTGRFYLNITEKSLSTDLTAKDYLQIYTANSLKQIVIKGPLQGGTSASLYDMKGLLVSRQNLDASRTSNTIDVRSISDGVYVVKLENNQLVKTQKVIIK